MWGPGKLAAVPAWADERGIDLAESYAYSDSRFDLPLLSAVGHPVAVNPDPRLLAIAVAARWPVLHLDVPAGIPKVPVLNIEPQQALMALARLANVPFARFDIDGWENIPEEGPAIIVGNHRSYFDPLAMGTALAKRGRPVRFLGKKEVFDVPLAGPVLKAMGGIRVDRGTGSDEPLKEAAAALAGRAAHRPDARGHDPARPGLLRAEAQGPLGRGPPGGDDRRAGDPRRPVGHREGVAPIEPHARTC